MNASDAPVSYTALIRTFNSAPLVYDTIAALRSQTCPPSSIVIVDSGSDDAQRQRLRELGDCFVDITGRPFNYSFAINEGLKASTGTHVLIISSHMGLNNPALIQRGIESLQRMDAAGFYCCYSDARKPWEEFLIDQKTFNNRNGLSNSFGFIPLADALKRPFREEVFSAEDQEWAKWFIREQGQRMVRIETVDLTYLNPRFNFRKKINEEVALACYVDRSLLSYKNIGKTLFMAAGSFVKGSFDRARLRVELAKRLYEARKQTPDIRSRYF
jgi:glycosyltransferase involved in cell wall biosynthesis